MPLFRIETGDLVRQTVIQHRTEARECRTVLAEMVAKLHDAGWPKDYRWSVAALDVFEDGEWIPYV